MTSILPNSGCNSGAGSTVERLDPSDRRRPPLRSTYVSTSSPSIVKLALVAGVVLSLAACASRPKPAPLAPPAPPPPPSAEAPPPPPPPPVGEQQTGPVPGSTQDFVINAGDRVYFDYDAYSVRADAGPILDHQAE